MHNHTKFIGILDNRVSQSLELVKSIIIIIIIIIITIIIINMPKQTTKEGDFKTPQSKRNE